MSRSWKGGRLAVLAVAVPTLAVLAAGAFVWSSEREAQELPEGVTPAMVDSGRAVFVGKGLCYTCHGEDGRGVEELGSDLRNRDWAHTDGSYGGLVELIGEGLTAQESSTGIPMPPRGGAKLSDPEVRASAAYVWVLSYGGG